MFENWIKELKKLHKTRRRYERTITVGIHQKKLINFDSLTIIVITVKDGQKVLNCGIIIQFFQSLSNL